MARSGRPPPRWAIAVFSALVLLFGLMIVHDLVTDPPALETLRTVHAVLTQPVTLVKPSGRGGSGPYGEVNWAGGRARLRHLCFLSNCALPEALATLKAGDALDLWVKNGVVWQARASRGLAVGYDEMCKAYGEAMHRRVAVMTPIWLLTVVLAVTAHHLRRSRAAGDSR